MQNELHNPHSVLHTYIHKVIYYSIEFVAHGYAVDFQCIVFLGCGRIETEIFLHNKIEKEKQLIFTIGYYYTLSL